MGIGLVTAGGMRSPERMRGNSGCGKSTQTSTSPRRNALNTSDEELKPMIESRTFCFAISALETRCVEPP